MWGQDLQPHDSEQLGSSGMEWTGVRPGGLQNWMHRAHGHSLALFVQQIEEASGLLADQVDAANVVCVVDVVP